MKYHIFELLRNIIYLNFGERHKDMIDYRSLRKKKKKKKKKLLTPSNSQRYN